MAAIVEDSPAACVVCPDPSTAVVEPLVGTAPKGSVVGVSVDCPGWAVDSVVGCKESGSEADADGVGVGGPEFGPGVDATGTPVVSGFDLQLKVSLTAHNISCYAYFFFHYTYLSQARLSE